MKKIFVLLMIFALLLTACGTQTADGGETGDTDALGTEEMPNTEEDPTLPPESYAWQSAWTGWSDDEGIFTGALNLGKLQISYMRHLPLYRVDSTAELEAFKEKFDGILSLDGGYDENRGFNTVAEHCDEGFFETKTLFIVYMEAGSGSFRYGVRSVAISDGEMLIQIEQTNDPEVYTDDMSGWFVITELAREDIEGCSSFDAIYAGIKGREEPVKVNKNSEPPKLNIHSPEGNIEASMGTSSWFYTNDDGTSASVMYDSAHPVSEMFFEVMPRLANDKFKDYPGYAECKLGFDFHREPAVTVRRWNAELVGQEGADLKAEKVEVTDGILFQVNREGCYIYEVTAVWQQTDGIGGNVTYVFAVGPEK